MVKFLKQGRFMGYNRSGRKVFTGKTATEVKKKFGKTKVKSYVIVKGQKNKPAKFFGEYKNK